MTHGEKEVHAFFHCQCHQSVPMTIMPVLNRITERLQGQRCLKGDLGVKVVVVLPPPPPFNHYQTVIIHPAPAKKTTPVTHKSSNDHNTQ